MSGVYWTIQVRAGNTEKYRNKSILFIVYHQSIPKNPSIHPCKPFYETPCKFCNRCMFISISLIRRFENKKEIEFEIVKWRKYELSQLISLTNIHLGADRVDGLPGVGSVWLPDPLLVLQQQLHALHVLLVYGQQQRVSRLYAALQ